MDSTEYKTLKGSKCVTSKGDNQLQMEWRFDYYEYFRKATPFVPYRSCTKEELMNTNGWSLFLSSVSCRDIESTSVYLNLGGDYCDVMKDYIVTFQIVILNMLEPKLSICKTHRHYVFNSSQSTWGFKYMFRKSEILEKNFIYNGILTIICTINFEDVNKLDTGTRFLLSSKVGDEDSVIDLLNNNVSVNVKSPLFIYPYHSLFPGATPLIIASNYNQIKIVDLLLHNKDCNINGVNYDNETALHRSCWNGNKEIVMALLNMDANINIKTKLGNTPLMLACRTEMKDIVEILLNHKPDLTVQNEDGDTALHIACYSNNTDIVKLLVDAGADITVSNERGLKPIDVTKSELVRRIIIAKDVFPTFKSDPNASFSPPSLYILSVLIEAIIPLQEGDPIYIPDVKVYPFNYLHPAEVLMLMYRLSQNSLDGKALQQNLLQESAYYAIFKTYGLWIENEINEDNNSSSCIKKKSTNSNIKSSDLTDDDDLSTSSNNINTYYRNLLLDALSSILGDKIKKCISMSHTTMNVWNTMIDILVCCCIRDHFWEKREIFLDANCALTEYKLHNSGTNIISNKNVKGEGSVKVLSHLYYKSIPPCVDKVIISGIRDRLRQICCKNPQHPEKRPYISNSFISKHIINTDRNPVYNIWSEIKPNELRSNKFPEKFPYKDVYEYFVELREGEQEMSWIITNKNLLCRGYQDHFWSIHRQILFGNENEIFTARINYDPSTFSFYVKKEYRNIDTFKVMSEIGERYRNNICSDTSPTFIFRKIIRSNPKCPMIVSDEWIQNRYILECFILRIIGERIYEGYNKRQLQYLADEMAVLLVQEEEEEAKRKAKNKKNNKRKNKKGKKKGKSGNKDNNNNNNDQQQQQQKEPPPPPSTTSTSTTKQSNKKKENESEKNISDFSSSLSDYEATLLTSPFDIKTFDKVIDALRLIRSNQNSMPQSFFEYNIEDLISSDDLMDITPERLLHDLKEDDKNSEDDEDVKYEFDDNDEREEGELASGDEELFAEEGEIILESDKDDDDDKKIEDGEIRLIIDKIETIPINKIKDKDKEREIAEKEVEKEKDKNESIPIENPKETEMNDKPVIKGSEKLTPSIKQQKNNNNNPPPSSSSSATTSQQQTPKMNNQSRKKRRNNNRNKNNNNNITKQKETQEELKKEIDKLSEKLKEKENIEDKKDDEIQLKIIEPLFPLEGQMKEVDERSEENNIKLCVTTSINSLIVNEKEEERERKEKEMEKEMEKAKEKEKPKLSIVSSEPIYLENDKKEIVSEDSVIIPKVSTPPPLCQQNDSKLQTSSPSLNQFRPVDINAIFGKSNSNDNRKSENVEMKVIESNNDSDNQPQQNQQEVIQKMQPTQQQPILHPSQQQQQQLQQQQNETMKQIVESSSIQQQEIIQQQPIQQIHTPEMHQIQQQLPIEHIQQIQSQYQFEQVIPDNQIQFNPFTQYTPNHDIPNPIIQQQLLQQLSYYYPNMSLLPEMNQMVYQTQPPLPPPPQQQQQQQQQQTQIPVSYPTDNLQNQQYIFDNTYFDYNSYTPQAIPKDEVIETSPSSLQYLHSYTPIVLPSIDSNNEVDYSKPYSLFEGNTVFEREHANELPICERCGMNYCKILFFPCKHLFCLRCKAILDNDKLCPICGIDGFDIEISKSL